MTPPTVVFSALRGYAIGSSRRELLDRFLSGGWSVELATVDDAEARALAAQGARLAPVPFRRGGFAPRGDAAAFLALRRIARRSRPCLVHLFHGKPILVGAPAFRGVLGDAVRIVATVTGLGRAFSRDGTLARLAGAGFGFALPRVDATIFQNQDDLELFLERGWVTADRAVLVAGSGVDLGRFAFVDRTSRRDPGRTVVLLARLLREKGIREFLEIARRVRAEKPSVRFVLAGEEEPGVHGVTPAEIRGTGAVDYVGRLADVAPLLAEADLFLFPSRYREGVPRALLEAAATGLPAVAFDVPGVREAVEAGVTGYLVAPGDLDAMTARVRELLGDACARRRMGRAGRRLVETRFDRAAIQARYLEVYRSLGVAVP